MTSMIKLDNLKKIHCYFFIYMFNDNFLCVHACVCANPIHTLHTHILKQPPKHPKARRMLMNCIDTQIVPSETYNAMERKRK